MSEKIAVITDAGLTHLADKIGDNFSTKEETSSAIAEAESTLNKEIKDLSTQIASPFTYKGTVNNLSDLPASNNVVNDTYYVKNEEYRVTWNGSAWKQSSMDETDYADELSKALRSKTFPIRHSNLHGYTDLNDLEANFIYELYSDVTEEDIVNLPEYGKLSYVLTLSYDNTTQYSSQIFYNTTNLYLRIKGAFGWLAWVKLTNESDLNVIRDTFLGIDLNILNTDYNNLVANVNKNSIFNVDKNDWLDLPNPIASGTATIINAQVLTDYDIQICIGRNTNDYFGWRIIRHNNRSVYRDWTSPTEKAFNELGNMFGFGIDLGAGRGTGTVEQIIPDDLPNRNVKTAYHAVLTSDSGTYGIKTSSMIRVIKGQTYTISAWVKGNGDVRLNAGGVWYKDFSTTDTWQKIQYTFTVSETQNLHVYFSNVTQNSDVYIADPQFKLVNDSLSPLYKTVTLKGDWELGTLGPSTGEKITSTSRLRSRVFMRFPNVADNKLIMTIPAGYGMNYRIYNADESFVKSVSTIVYAGENDLPYSINIDNEHLYKFVIFPDETYETVIDSITFAKTNIHFTYQTCDEVKPIRILSVGNSHTRDAVRYVAHILNKNGFDAEVGHYYWGGSTLKEQYEALCNAIAEDPEDLPFPDAPAFPSASTFYRCYNKFGTYTSPASWTLVNAIYDKPWDIIVFQQQTLASGDYSSYFSNAFNFNDFITLLKTLINNENAQIGLMAVHTRASDYTGDPVTPSELEEMIQSTTPRVAKNMNQCNFVINTGLGIKYARTNEYLDAIGDDMCRTDDNGVHLQDGIPQYLASMVYAMTLVGKFVGDKFTLPPRFTMLDEPSLPSDYYLAFLAIQYARYAVDDFSHIEKIILNQITNS